MRKILVLMTDERVKRRAGILLCDCVTIGYARSLIIPWYAVLDFQKDFSVIAAINEAQVVIAVQRRWHDLPIVDSHPDAIDFSIRYDGVGHKANAADNRLVLASVTFRHLALDNLFTRRLKMAVIPPNKALFKDGKILQYLPLRSIFLPDLWAVFVYGFWTDGSSWGGLI